MGTPCTFSVNVLQNVKPNTITIDTICKHQEIHEMSI